MIHFLVDQTAILPGEKVDSILGVFQSKLCRTNFHFLNILLAILKDASISKDLSQL